jgi:glycosyltransferase involved in cell wall biosynthesis
LARLLPPQRCHRLLPFLDADPSAPPRLEARRDMAREFGLPLDEPWILAVAMMRAPDKLASYRLLAAAAQRLLDRPWRMVVVGDGPERPAVEAAFAPMRERVAFAGLRTPEEIARFHAAADLFAWPAVNEAYGMAILEAEAAGLPVVAGRVGGVPEIVADGRSGILVAGGDAEAFADGLEQLLHDAALRQRLGRGAAQLATERHGFAAAVARLDRIVRQVER